MEGIDVVDHCGTELDDAGPFLPIQQFNLHATPKRFDHRIVVTITDCPEAKPEPELFDPLGECPRRELGAMVGMNDAPNCRFPCAVCHEQG